MKRSAGRLERLGKQKEAHDDYAEAQRLLDNTTSGPWLAAAEVLRLAPKDDERIQQAFQKALDDTKARKRNKTPNFVMALLHLLNKEPQTGGENVLRLIDDLKQNPSVGAVLQVLQIYALTGQLAEARKFALQQLETNDRFQDLPVAMCSLEYYAGQRTAAEYLEASKETGSRTHRIFFVGLMDLADGRRTEALRRFHQVGQEGIFHAWEYDIATAFAERMERDESWPQWLKTPG